MREFLVSEFFQVVVVDSEKVRDFMDERDLQLFFDFLG